MQQFKFKVNTKEMLADVHTPVAIYLKMRDVYPKSILLEGADFKAGDNQYSFICMQPISGIKASGKNIEFTYPNGQVENEVMENKLMMSDTLQAFSSSFVPEGDISQLPTTGLFGYSTFESVSYFEDIEMGTAAKDKDIPELWYQFYKYIIAINHNNNTISIIEHIFNGEVSQIDSIEEQLNNRTFTSYRFAPKGEETSNLTADAYMDMVSLGKKHCMRGDVFQIVLSRCFQQSFTGDEFNVYRTLRSINPSPYLFYFDFGNFKLLGSSPEAQIKTSEGKAYINPIAGTFRRTGDDKQDKELSKQLANDPKENAEHIMLVDLARNDLSRHAENVKVKFFREVHYYSHVLHMVSEVEGDINANSHPVQIYGDTFPAGTLSGAPKYKAMELISNYENQARGFYGGCIGNIGLNGHLNLAIMIRSFMSKNNTLYYQAGAGVVAKSEEVNELDEVTNKLAALKLAIVNAQKI
ncbi:MAG: anthranilate synthase component I family protein [Bacteroidales bacterium]|jgi:anthranilate synthase component 1|nr:anthranilate synthase component I family protein [Bacteroidales bacterium]